AEGPPGCRTPATVRRPSAGAGWHSARLSAAAVADSIPGPESAVGDRAAKHLLQPQCSARIMGPNDSDRQVALRLADVLRPYGDQPDRVAERLRLPSTRADAAIHLERHQT